MVKLIYGLAKFSNKNYGFGSRPKNFDKKKFLFYISKYFDIFECADRYIGSNKYISLLKKKKIHFKIDKIPYKRSEEHILDYFLKKIKNYKSNHKIKKIEVLYIHQNELKILSNNKILNTLIFLKEKKLVKNFGVSIYSEKELLYVLKKEIFTYIQLPINIADSYYFSKYKNKLKRKIIIARSLVLQGTLLSNKINFKFKKQINYFRKYLSKISHENKISKEELIFRYIFSLKNLNYALIGSINKKNIKKILNFKKKGSLNKKLLKKLNDISQIKKNWSNPKNWN
jgi:aryl-alcohol dehydrogenase-like predicted oxidoreductase